MTPAPAEPREAGAALILAGVIVIELVPRRSGEANPADALPQAD